MSGAPRWRVRGAKPKEEQKEGWVLVGRGHPASNRRGRQLWIPPACRNEWIRRGAGFYFRAGRGRWRPEEEEKCAFPVRKSTKRCCHLSRPVSRGLGNQDRLRESLAWFLPPHRFANKEVILDLTIDHSFPTEPPLFAIRSTYLTSAFHFL